MTHPRFITFEGGEGSGKSTQVRLLADRLRALGNEAVLTREPGGSPLAEKIRDLILADKPTDPAAEFLLFAAARADHIHGVIAPALHRGALVICDRYIHSTRVYQGHLGHVPRDLILTVEQATVAPFIPALTVLLDVPAEVGLSRAAHRGDLNRFDRKDIDWHRRLRQAFLDEAASATPHACLVIDGNRPTELVAADIWAAVEAHLGLSSTSAMPAAVPSPHPAKQPR
jgi:dTMP kinase